MSGTSLDGIDLVYVTFDDNFKVIHAKTYKYTEAWFQKLNSAHQQTLECVKLLDIEYTQYLAEVICTFIDEFNIQRTDITAICSHGHTVFHKPEQKFTYQIGNRPELAQLTKLKVVCDFRVQDVALGGQGAPLVPIGDKLLFPEFHYCLNIGGFSNISFDKDGQRIAFDICPVNVVLNHYARQLGQEFDKNGELSRQGQLNEELLNKLNQLPNSFTHPKSMGIEQVHAEIIPLIDNYNISVQDKMRTYLQYVVDLISKFNEGSMLITGGGAYNQFLVELLKVRLPNLVIPDNNIVEFKEAIIFAFLGVLRLKNQINILKSVTGASQDHSSGMIYI